MTTMVWPRGLFELWPWLRRAGPLGLLLLATAALGMAGVPAARPLFIAGCVVVAWDSLRFGARTHLAACLVLFCLAPMLRRVVDASAGYEPSGIMVSGPLLAILVPTPRLVAALAAGQLLEPALRPFLLAAACAFYAILLTMFEGNLTLAASGGLKWAAPVLYGIWLYGEARRDPDIIDAAARTLIVIMPLLGLYGFLQYVDPPIWDRFWMTYTTIASIGEPEPYMVRVFSTMNAPAGYATFAAASLLLFGFRNAGWALLLAAGPTVLGLMLSLYRTAWIALAISIIVGLFNPRIRGRAATMMIAVVALIAAAASFTPEGDILRQRLLSLGSVSEDASGQERLGQYAILMENDGGTLVGHGFDATDVMQAGALALDGQIAVSWFSMGLVVGIVCVTAVCWAAWQAMRRAWRSPNVSGIAISLFMVGAVVQIPLAVMAASEIGFLFWSLAAIGAAIPVQRTRRLITTRTT